MARKRKNNLPPLVQKELDQIVAPPTITLDDYHIKLIMAYRATNAAYDQAVTTANAHTEDGMWTMADLFAVEEAQKAHQQSELEMAVAFASLAKRAGI